MKAKVLALIMCMVLALGLFTACGDGGSGSGDTVKAKVILVLEDKTEVTHEIEAADGTSLRTALFENGLIDEANNGAMFVATIDGQTADPMTDGVTWLPCDKDGNQLEHELEVETACAIDYIAVNEGDEIYLVYTLVPTFDD